VNRNAAVICREIGKASATPNVDLQVRSALAEQSFETLHGDGAAGGRGTSATKFVVTIVDNISVQRDPEIADKSTSKLGGPPGGAGVQRRSNTPYGGLESFSFVFSVPSMTDRDKLSRQA